MSEAKPQLVEVASRKDIILASEFEAATIERPDYILPPLIPRARLGMLVGNSTHGKTPFGYQLGRDVTAGRNFLDYFPCAQPYRVGIVDAESTREDITLRLQMQAGGRPAQIDDRLLIWNSEQAASSSLNLTRTGIGNLLDKVNEHKLDLLLLDNLFSLSGGQDIGRQNVVQPILFGLRRITELPHRPSVLFFHHPRKGSREHHRPSILTPDFTHWLEEASGSYVLVNLTDFRLGIERVEKSGEELTVLRGRSRVPGEEQDIGPLYLTIDEEHALAEIDRRPQVLNDAGDKTRKLLEELQRERQFERKDAYRIAATIGATRRTAQRAIRFAKEHGFITEEAAGRLTWDSGGSGTRVEGV